MEKTEEAVKRKSSATGHASNRKSNAAGIATSGKVDSDGKAKPRRNVRKRRALRPRQERGANLKNRGDRVGEADKGGED